ncbi:hypothetical protein [Geothermobacter hydrogeniphilus]|uniref:Uncharacterized protein n=1 Tax=Geothermobacter hydrogeniphilus TaxID=1969733 RepID=A0A1X0Y584_9BACT|nr:hypothetical protein [Geothermobacter hydrogeniphilus]ORJ60296.1 hypothetical protein B5V00_08575 [Geothermobacter hydrogeniphilus]
MAEKKNGGSKGTLIVFNGRRTRPAPSRLPEGNWREQLRQEIREQFGQNEKTDGDASLSARDVPQPDEKQDVVRQKGRSREAMELSRKIREAIARQPPMSPEECAAQTRRVLANARPIITRKSQGLPDSFGVDYPRPAWSSKYPKALTSRLDTTPRPTGNQLRSLLHLWLDIYHSADRHDTTHTDLLRFLRTVLEGRVVSVLEQFESSSDSRDREFARIVEKYGRKWRSYNSSWSASTIASGDYGWIGIEMGNPSWEVVDHALIIETPTAPELEVFAQDQGGEKRHNLFFASGFYRIDGCTLGWIRRAELLAIEYELETRNLEYRGLLVRKKN